MLTPQQAAAFRRDGYLVLEGFATDEQCQPLRQRAAELVASFDAASHKTIFTTDDQARRIDDYFLDSADRVHFFFEEEAFDDRGELRQPKELSINKIGHGLHDLEPVFSAFCRAPRVAEVVADLGLPEPRLMQSMYIFKQPHIGGAVRCHQDSTFLHTEPERLLGLWFALDDATIDNGCLWAIPGGHQLGLRSRFVRRGRATETLVLDPTPWDEADLVPLPVPRGGLVLLDGLVPHASAANRSSLPRHAYTLHVVSGEDEYPDTNWLQRRESARGFGTE